MSLSLKRPIVFFDLEATGLSISRDRIVELSVLKVSPGGLEERKTRRINPTIPISAEATAVHGISDEDVRECPTFAQIARNLYDWISGCDLGGFNSNRFDIPLLVEEFLRAGVEVDFHKRNLIDVQSIYHKMERRTLETAYRYYCGKDLVDAHSAEADVVATYEVFKAQLELYKEQIPQTMEGLAEFSRYSHNVDFAGTLIYNEKGEEVINIGKYKGRLAREVLVQDPGYYAWIMGADFTFDTKACFTRIRLSIK